MPAPNQQYDVVILGGGPGGSAAAIHLASQGRHVALLDRDASPKHKVCGEFLSAEALHLLHFLGVSPATHAAHPIHTVRLASGRRVIEAKLPFAAQSLTRRCLDATLLRAAEVAGVTVLRSASVKALTQAQDSTWNVSLSAGEGLTGRKVILATGKHDLRGFARPPGKQNDLVALKMYFRLAPAQAAALRNSVELLLHPYGYTGLQPVEDGCANLTALVRKHHLAKLGGWPGLLAELLAANVRAAQRLSAAEPMLDRPLAISSIPYGFVRREAIATDLYAIGDQAAVIPSFTGDGMSIALYSGITAAHAILKDEPAEVFQSRLHGTLRGQVARATALSRTLVYPAGKQLLTTFAQFWPGSMETIARLTRISPAALAQALA